jgi:hypothetical protein
VKKLLIVVFAVLGVVGAYTLGGASRAWAAHDESAAMQLSRLVLTRETYKEILEQTAAGISQGARASGEQLPGDFDKKLSLVVAEALPYDEMLAFNAQVYGSRFSDKELGEIVAFYKTPTGAKLIRELPGISKEAMLKVGGLMPKRLPGLLKKYGLVN